MGKHSKQHHAIITISQEDRHKQTTITEEHIIAQCPKYHTHRRVNGKQNNKLFKKY